MSSHPATALDDLMSPSDLAALRPTSTITHTDRWDENSDRDVWDVVVDGHIIATFDTEDEAVRLRGALEDHVKKLAGRAHLVQGIRQLADFIDQAPIELPAPKVFATHRLTVAYGTPDTEARDLLVGQLRDLHARLGDHEVVPDRYGDFELVVTFPGDINLRYEVALDKVCTPTIEDGKVVWLAPELDEPALGEQIARAA